MPTLLDSVTHIIDIAEAIRENPAGLSDPQVAKVQAIHRASLQFRDAYTDKRATSEADVQHYLDTHGSEHIATIVEESTGLLKHNTGRLNTAYRDAMREIYTWSTHLQQELETLQADAASIDEYIDDHGIDIHITDDTNPPALLGAEDATDAAASDDWLAAAPFRISPDEAHAIEETLAEVIASSPTTRPTTDDMSQTQPFYIDEDDLEDIIADADAEAATAEVDMEKTQPFFLDDDDLAEIDAELTDRQSTRPLPDEYFSDLDAELQATNATRPLPMNLFEAAIGDEDSRRTRPIEDTRRWWRRWLDFAAFTALWLAIPLVSLAVWLMYVPQVDPYAMNDLGLVAAMPPLMFVPLVAMIISFCIHLYRPRSYILFTHLVVIIFMLYHIMHLVGEAPRFSTTWVHLGFVENILRRGFNDVNIDARMSWPGFFAMGGFFTESSGYPLGIPFVGYATIFLNYAFIGPLYMIYSGITAHKRLVWFALLVFYLSNWVGQDYYAPQGLNFLFYITILGILLYWFKAHTLDNSHKSQLMWFGERLDRWLTGLGNRGKRWRWLTQRIKTFLFSADQENPPTHRYQRSAFVMFIFILMLAMAGSHQLTPFFTLFALMALIVFRRIQLSGVGFLSGLLTSTWIIYMTSAYLAGNLQDLIGDIGALGNSIEANVTERVVIAVSAQRQFVLDLRIYSTLLLWVLMGVSMIRQFITQRWTVNAILIALPPFLVMGLQNYGGEGLLRILFFTLVGSSFLIADLFYQSHRQMVRWRTVAASAVFALVLLASFMFTRYGNEKMDFMSYDDLEGMTYLYEIAEPDSLFLTYAWNGPQLFRDYEVHDIALFQEEYDEMTIPDVVKTLQQEDDIVQAWQEEDEDDHNARPYAETYLYMSRAGAAFGELFRGLPIGWQDDFADDLEATGYFELVFANDDFRIYRLSEAGEAADVSSATVIR